MRSRRFDLCLGVWELERAVRDLIEALREAGSAGVELPGLTLQWQESRLRIRTPDLQLDVSVAPEAGHVAPFDR